MFLIKYLNSKGFNLTNDSFQKKSWYFRNALVRANYSNYLLNIDETTYYLENFLENLMFNTNHILSNKVLHISYKENINKYFELSINEKAIIDMINEKPDITIDECSIKLNKSLRTTKELFKKLKEKNVIERVGSKKTGRWLVK